MFDRFINLSDSDHFLILEFSLYLFNNFVQDLICFVLLLIHWLLQVWIHLLFKVKPILIIPYLEFLIHLTLFYQLHPLFILAKIVSFIFKALNIQLYLYILKVLIPIQLSMEKEALLLNKKTISIQYFVPYQHIFHIQLWFLEEKQLINKLTT